jgi:hypothetical protein
MAVIPDELEYLETDSLANAELGSSENLGILVKNRLRDVEPCRLGDRQ